MGIEKFPPLPNTPLDIAGEGEAGRHDGRIGVPLEHVRSRMAEIAGRLEPILDTHALPIITEARRVLREQTCRVAVIGQIKAGKSSFINALMQRPELLPTDINPWTAVVTSLHFRNDGPPPAYAAEFELFSREEWQRLAEGGGRLRELTERLVPGFEPELLRAQIEMMRQRVEQRLGTELDPLLGQTHRYETVTPELLDDYIAAGTYLDGHHHDEQPGGQRQYSDITREANLYFTGGPFAYPVTLVDTPGTNDPFLVRDEITRRSLENSEIYVFVVSALQPLSATDISLLRILNGLHKDRIIVFVNRIDQLRDPIGDAGKVKDNVKLRLQREFPNLDIPVIIGSAWWGGLSLAAPGKDVSRILPRSTIAFLRGCGLPEAVKVAPGQPVQLEDRSKLALALHEASGLPAIAETMTTQMNGGSAAVLLRQLAVCFLELARSTEVSAKMELQSQLSLAEARRAEARALGERIAQEREALTQLDEPIRQIQQSFSLIERQLGEIVSQSLERLGNDLKTIVENNAAEEVAAMVGAIRRRDHDGEWRADLRVLREDMETHYIAAFRSTEARLMEIERVLYPQLKTIVNAILPGSGIDVSDDFALPSNPYPSLASLSETAVLDLDVPWWKLWFAVRPDPRERAETLNRLILEDFMPVADQLTDQAAGIWRGRVEQTLKQANAVSSGMLAAIQSRKSQVLADYEALMDPEVGVGSKQVEAEQNQKIANCEARHALAGELVEELVELSNHCQKTLMTEFGPS